MSRALASVVDELALDQIAESITERPTYGSLTASQLGRFHREGFTTGQAVMCAVIARRNGRKVAREWIRKQPRNR